MELLKDLSSETLLIIISILIIAMGGLLRLTILFAKSASEKIVLGIKTDMQAVLRKQDTHNRHLVLIGINVEAMHQTFEDLFNGEYKESFAKKRKELIENAEFLRTGTNNE